MSEVALFCVRARLLFGRLEELLLLYSRYRSLKVLEP